MTILVSSPSTHDAQEKGTHVQENSSSTRGAYIEGINPVLETSKWAVKVSICRRRPATASHASDNPGNRTRPTQRGGDQVCGEIRACYDRLRSCLKYADYGNAQIHAQMQREAYVPRTWRTHPLHICPADPFSWKDPSTSACLNWIFFISSLNFSFWSELEGQRGRYGVEWREGWGSEDMMVHTGYWSLVAAVDRGERSVSCMMSGVRDVSRVKRTATRC